MKKMLEKEGHHSGTRESEKSVLNQILLGEHVNKAAVQIDLTIYMVPSKVEAVRGTRENLWAYENSNLS